MKQLHVCAEREPAGRGRIPVAGERYLVKLEAGVIPGARGKGPSRNDAEPRFKFVARAANQQVRDNGTEEVS